MLGSHECACCLLFDVRQYHCHFSILIGSFLYQRAKLPQRTVLFINLLGKGLTLRACMGDRGSIWWAPASSKLKLAHEGMKITWSRRCILGQNKWFWGRGSKGNQFHFDIRVHEYNILNKHNLPSASVRKKATCLTKLFVFITPLPLANQQREKASYNNNRWLKLS